MKRLTRFMVRNFLPDHVLIEKADTEEYFRELTRKHMPGFHLHRNRKREIPGLDGVPTEGPEAVSE